MPQGTWCPIPQRSVNGVLIPLPEATEPVDRYIRDAGQVPHQTYGYFYPT